MNVKEYIKKYGKISSKIEPFNYIDYAIFTHLTYCNFDNYIPSSGITIEQLGNKFFSDNSFDDYDPKKDKLMMDEQCFKLIYKCDRYKDLLVHDFVSILDSDSVEQFAAMIIDLPNKSSVISFRGTDGSMIGWHEDLMLSYREVKAQDDALKYLKQKTKLFHKYIVIGHSKGGNLALYACAMSGYFLRRRITEIISYDGPDLRPTSTAYNRFDLVKNRYTKIIPNYEVVGSIYNRCENIITVKSSIKGLMAHNALTWMIDDNKFSIATNTIKESDAIAQTIRTFEKNTTNKQREEFVSLLFSNIDEAGITTIYELFDSGKDMLVNSIKNITSINAEAKKAISTLIQAVAVSYLSLIKQEASVIKKDITGFIDKHNPFKKGN